MAEEPEQAPAEEQDSPQPDAPEESQDQGTPSEPEEAQTAEPEVDYEQRFNDTRAALQERDQFLAAVRANEPWALQELGLELEEQPQQEEEYVDPEDEIQAIKAYLAEQEQAQEMAQFQAQEEAYIDSTVQELEKRENLQLSDEEFQLVVSAALTNREQDGRPDLEGAFKALKAIQANAHERYIESKKAPKAPSGTAGERQFDTSSEEGRREAMLAYMGEASQE